MSYKKSLGSSPIGFSTTSTDSLHFIPDLGISKYGGQAYEQPVQRSRAAITPISRFRSRDTQPSNEARTESVPEKPNNKKIVSYYLDEMLVQRIKYIADEKGMYYSTLVANALKSWIKKQGL